MLLEEVDAKPDVEECGQDLAEAVIPRVDGGVGHRARSLVGGVLFEGPRHRPFEVGEFDLEVTAAAFPIERPHHWVALPHQERASRLREPGHDLGPALDVREPADRSDTGVYDVELLVEHRRCPVHVRHDPAGIETHVPREPVGHVERGLREVDAGHGGAEPPP